MVGARRRNPAQSTDVGQLLGYNFSNATIRALEEDPKQLRNRALAAMIEYFRAVSSSPVIALLEDLHWADDSSLDILIRLSLIQTERPVLIVAAARPELSERRPDFMRDQPYHHWLKLKPLSMSNSRRLVKEILKKAVALPDNLRDEVAAKADGNPYYVEELVKMLVADGIIVKEDSGWHILAQKLTMIQIPTTVAGVLQARLNSLPQIERAIMQRASIMGRIFWNLPITNMNYQDEEQLSVIEVEAGLAALRNKEMIYKLEASEFAGSDEYTFKHAILRDVTYESVLKWARKTYHALAANWLMD